jgi:trimeric autotransporter adhesin
MAKTLTQVGIETGNLVEAYHVTQSIDAFTGVDAYDISLSGSLNITGSLSQGSGTQASGVFSHAEGQSTQAIGDVSHAEGASQPSNRRIFTRRR